MDKITIEREALEQIQDVIRQHANSIQGDDFGEIKKAENALRAALAAQPAPAAVPPGYALVPVEPTPEMVAAYLDANTKYWRFVDEQPPKVGIWRNGTPAQATEEAYRAMIAAAAGDKP